MTKKKITPQSDIDESFREYKESKYDNLGKLFNEIIKSYENDPRYQEKVWKVKNKVPPDQPESPDTSATDARPKLSRQEILAPLDEVFLDDRLKDDIVVRTAIPNLLEGSEPAHNGVILFGPPGTGKTVLLKAIGKVYELSGSYAKEISTSAINSSFVSHLARNLEAEIKEALSQSSKRNKPSLLYFDEGSILAQNPEEGANTVAKHYQEAMDVLKRYIGNERNLVVGISTNLLAESFEEALTREGRLTSFFIGYPNVEQRRRMWRHFAGKYAILSLNNKQDLALAQATPEEQGAFIEEFCRCQRGAARSALVKARGFATLVDALKNSEKVTEEEITRAISFETLYAGVTAAIQAKYDRLGQQAKGNGIGFK